MKAHLGRLGVLKPLGITIKVFNKTISIKDVVNKQLRVCHSVQTLKIVRNFSHAVSFIRF